MFSPQIFQNRRETTEKISSRKKQDFLRFVIKGSACSSEKNIFDWNLIKWSKSSLVKKLDFQTKADGNIG